MSTAYRLPLIAQSQQMQIQLNGVTYTLRVYWCDPAQCWTIDIGDVNGNPIVTGIAMTTNDDLLGQYGYLNFGGKLIAQTNSVTRNPPTFTNLGTDGNLYFVTTP